jgi:hypothetical protein
MEERQVVVSSSENVSPVLPVPRKRIKIDPYTSSSGCDT